MQKLFSLYFLKTQKSASLSLNLRPKSWSSEKQSQSFILMAKSSLLSTTIVIWALQPCHLADWMKNWGSGLGVPLRHSDCFSRCGEQNYSLKTKLRIYNAVVISTLLHGSETWANTNTEEKKLDVFDNRRLRRILGIKWFHRERNTTVRERTSQTPTSLLLTTRRFGDVSQIDQQKTSQSLIAMEAWECKTKKGGEPHAVERCRGTRC